MQSGFLVINKQPNMTSFDVIRDIRRTLNTKKVGHSGTLDPMATGVLVVAVGKATKYIPLLSKNKYKTYILEMEFGLHTDTYDIEGQVLQREEVEIHLNELEQVIKSFICKYDQYPPIYSAKKVDGKRLYEYARSNQEVEIKSSSIEIFDLKIISSLENNKITLEAKVSKGTYIRSLIVDIAKELGTIATMTKLKRIESDGFHIDQAIEIGDIKSQEIINFAEYLGEKYYNVIVSGNTQKLVENGYSFEPLDIEYPIVYTTEKKEVLALYKKVSDQVTKPIILLENKNENL